jgi:hypothetical protein
VIARIAAVPRLIYQASGVIGICSQDGALSLSKDSFSMGVRRRMAEGASFGSFDHAVERIKTTTGASIAKRQVEQLAQASAVDFEAFYTAQTVEPEGDPQFLVLTFDGAGIRMRTESLREDTRREAEKSANEPKMWPARLKAGEKSNHKRMAEVAAVYGIAPYVRTTEDVLGELSSIRLVRPERQHARARAAPPSDPAAPHRPRARLAPPGLRVLISARCERDPPLAVAPRSRYCPSMSSPSSWTPGSAWTVDPDDPRAPPEDVWDALSPAERKRIVDSLPSEFPYSEAQPPEGDAHFKAKTATREVLDGYFARVGRRVYLACELPNWPGEHRATGAPGAAAAPRADEQRRGGRDVDLRPPAARPGLDPEGVRELGAAGAGAGRSAAAVA